ncbi:molybdopterin-containing oxidoreductase family protein [Raoultibacter phocaeensis]|uniref:molybdopterin-containing oxidoreductase family protein n=1 Tax=Raoultibacter phocaeensis TaxID=2479841 RepID=UPI001118165C|nr:molybdopterin-dependent oxidoreductase [Raoultibacter phocaeensis]
MSGTNSSQGGLTRRSFLKTTGAVAGAAGVVGVSSMLSSVAVTEAHAEGAAAVDGEQVFRTSCRGNCGSRCPQEVVVRDGKVVRTTAAQLPGEDNVRRRLCVKGYTQPQRLYEPDRLKYPMKRVGWSPESPNGEQRGNDEWERISWDEAIETVSAEIGRIMKEHGPSSVALWTSYGSNNVLNGTSAGFMSVAYGRFITSTGITVLGASADYAQLKTQMSDLAVTGNDCADIANSKTIMAWGGNPAEAYIHDWQFVCEAREKGAKLITIDPQYTASAMHSDIYVPIRPGTDGALMLGMANYIIENDLIDYDFMKQKTVSPLLIKEDGTYFRMSDLGVEPTEGPINPYTGMPSIIDPNVVWDSAANGPVMAAMASDPELLGSFEVEGVSVQTVYQKTKDSITEYTVEKAAEICDLPVETVEMLAKTYATEGPVAVLTYQGIGHHVNSHHNYKNLSLIGALTGNAGKPGAMLFRAYGTSMPTNSQEFMLGKVALNICGMYLPQIIETKKWAGNDLDIRMLFCTNGNMLSCESGRVKLIEAVKKVDCIVCADVNMTDTARFADILLPVTHAYETEDFDGGGSTPFPTYYHKVVDPHYECKTDLEIMRLIADKLGMGEIYAKSDEEFLRAIIDTPANIQGGCGYDDFHKGELVKNYAFTEKVLVDTFEKTPTQRLQYYIEKPMPRNNFGQEIADYERIPHYEHANEAYWENPLREKYPLMGCSEHPKYHVHSQCAHTPWLRELEPEPLLKVNASDAKERGIEQGDVVKVYNDHGYAVLKALVTEGIKPGVVSIPHGWQQEQFVEGHTQDLTSIQMNDFVSNSAFYDFLCEVEKYQ